MMGDVMVTAPAVEPVDVAELRAHLRDPGDADAVLSLLIGAAREYVEEELGICLIHQGRRLTLDAWPVDGDGLGWWDGVQDGALIGRAPRYVELPRAPLAEITSVQTYDEAGNATTWGASSYFADTGTRPGRLALAAGGSWPVPTRSAAGITIDYVAGYGDAKADVPSSLRLAILQLAAHWYENRELVSTEAANRVPMQAARIISSFRIAKL